MKINEKFKPLWTSNTRYYLVTGGRGSGKSFGVGCATENMLFEKGQKILYTRYTLTAASKSIIPEFIEKIELFNHSRYFTVTNNEIRHSNGSSIMFSGIKTSSGNQTANLKSLQGVTTWVLDEAEELDSEEVFDKIDLSVRQKGIQNRVILLLNPTLRSHWIYDRFFEKPGVEEGFNGVKGDVTYIHTTYLDNIPNLHESFINRANELKGYDYEMYVHVMLGAWLDMLTGRMYTTLKEYDDLPEGESVMYCDTADTGADYLVAVFANKCENGLYVKDVVCTQEPQEITEGLVASAIIRNKTNRAVIESNNGGRAFGRNVQRLLNDMNWRRVTLTFFHQSKNKDSRILNNSSTISLNVYFCKGLRKTKYMLMMKTYSREEKNEHDDPADATTGLVEHFFHQNKFFVI